MVFSAINPIQWSRGQPTWQQPRGGNVGVRWPCSRVLHAVRGHFLPEPGIPNPPTVGLQVQRAIH